MIAWLLPGLLAPQRTLVANLLAGFIVDIAVVSAVKALIKRRWVEVVTKHLMARCLAWQFTGSQ